MIKKLTLLISFVFVALVSHTQVVISEIMYNPPESGADSLEYIELYNASNQEVLLNGFTFGQGVMHDFTSESIAAGNYLLLCKNAGAMMSALGVSCTQWDDGSLSNGGEDIQLLDNNGTEVDYVDYMNSGTWPTFADGTNGAGASIELCDLQGDNNDGLNWRASNTDIGAMVNGMAVKGTPGAAAASDLCDPIMAEAPVAGDIVITELYINDPGGLDSLEYVELYNASDKLLDLSNVSFQTTLIDFTFPATTQLDKSSYLVLTHNSDTYSGVFNTESIEWKSQSSDTLSNYGDSIIIIDAEQNVLERIDYNFFEEDWPRSINNVASINLCNIESDNNDPSNWQVSSGNEAGMYQGFTIVGNPGSESICGATIAEIRMTDADGVPLLNGENVLVRGIAHGSNLRPSGLQFTLIDESLSTGIGLFSGGDNFGYTLTEGDLIEVSGTVGHFNGLTQISLDGVTLISQNNALVDPAAVTVLDESTESMLVKIEDVSLVDPADWEGNGGGFNVDVTDGTNTYNIRIDNDVDLSSMEAPSGTFDIIGIGSQFDNSAPYTEGYQLLPRRMTDIDPYVVSEIEYPAMEISDLKVNNADGTATNDGMNATISGVVHGVNLSTSGLSLTLIDPDTGDGIRFIGSPVIPAVEGDEIELKGKVDQFNGLTEFDFDSLKVLNSGVDLVEPVVITELTEDTESRLVTINNLTYVNISQWEGDGGGFNVELTDGTNIYDMRIDNDTELSSMPAPTAPFNLTGIGGQFDSEAPFDSGYQILPRYLDDFDQMVNNQNVDLTTVSPVNTLVNDVIFIQFDTDYSGGGNYILRDMRGQLVQAGPLSDKIYVNKFAAGLFLLELEVEGRAKTFKIAKY